MSREAFEAMCQKRWSGDRDGLTIREDGEYLLGPVEFEGGDEVTEIRIEWTETSPHSKPQSGSVALKTDGTIDGLIEAFLTAVVGMGYSTETAGKLGLQEAE